MAEERTPEELERADKLFQKLAAEEPPLSKLDDTAPSKTAPRQAVLEEPRRMARYWIIGLMAVLLLVTVAITALVFASSNEEDPVSEDNEAAVTDEAPAIIQETATAQPIQENSPVPLTPTRAAATATMLPTAASDEIAVALQAPIVLPEHNGVALSSNPFTIVGSDTRTEVITYTVNQGDTLGSIAERFGLEACTLIYSNAWNKVNPPQPGAVLDIIPVDGVFYYVEKNISIQNIAAETGVDPFDILNFPANAELMDDTPETILIEGMKVVVPGGKLSECNIWTPNTVAGDGTAGASGGGGINWGCSYTLGNTGFPGLNPLQSSYRFFQGFTSVHSGVDLSAATGTPVYASGGGTVAFAGTHAHGYGNAIVIDHGNGVFTLYGHLSSINVSCGQNVNQGDMIGAVGSTGRSSGPHLHFEVRVGGFTPVDPLQYVSM